MNTLTNFSFLIGSQIRYLVTNVNRKNLKTTTAEIHHLIELYGHDAYLFFLRSLIANVDFKDQKGQKDQLRIQMLQQEISQLMKDPNFATYLCEALEGNDPIQEDFLIHFSKLLKLPVSQEVLLALALVHSWDPNLKQEGIKYMKTRLPDLTNAIAKTLPENLLHNLVYFLRTNEGFEKQAQILMKGLQKLSNNIPVHFIPLLSEDDNNIFNVKQTYSREGPKPIPVNEFTKSLHISSIMEELGYPCCENASVLKDVLSQFPELKELDVAQILAMMARTHTGLESSPFPLCSFPPNPDAEKIDANSKSWNINIFIDTLKEMYPKLNWSLVIKNLDHPGFQLSDAKGLALILSFYRKATKDPFPVELLFDTWNNPAGQLSFLKLAVAGPPDAFNFVTASKRVDVEGLPSFGKNSGTVNHWYSLSLIETLLRLADIEGYGTVRNIFNYPIKHCPELLIIGLAQAKSTSTLAGELSSVILPNILLSNNPSSNFVIHKIWNIKPSLLLKGMVELHAKDPTCLGRLFEIATHELKSLTQVLEARPFSFVLELAGFAFRKDALDFEKWLQEKMTQHTTSFARACVQHLKEKISKTPKGEKQFESLVAVFAVLYHNASILPADIVDEIKALSTKFSVPVGGKPDHAVTTAVPPGLVPQHQTSISQPPSTVHGLGMSHGTPTPPPMNPLKGPTNPGGPQPEARVFPPEVEDIANAYFQKIYTGQISIEEVVGLLKRYKNSKDQREQDVFACMIHNLFDEYRFFPKYPDKELQITGMLFGSLIQHQLVSFLPLGVALRYVLDALRKQPGSKMFKFGLTALEQFKTRLSEWPQYCAHILAIPHIHRVPEVAEFVERSRQAGPSSSTPSGGSSFSSESTGTLSQAPTTGQANLSGSVNGVNMNLGAFPTNTNTDGVSKIETYMDVNLNTSNLSSMNQSNANAPSAASSKEASPTVPKKEDEQTPLSVLIENMTKNVPPMDVNISDKIHFIFNNVSQLNMDQKVSELRDLLKTDEHIQYLAFYMVVKRAVLENNFHNLYMTVLDKLKNPRLYQLILQFTLDCAKFYVYSKEVIVSSPERVQLKNLGSWLGLLTLAKNKPLLQKHIALKELLLEAYEQGRLIAAIPFVCKVLETCANSKVFKPPNPWVMALMRVLSELYRKPNLKLNLKFEVEVLCKALGLDIGDIKPSELLKDKKQNTTDALEGTQKKDVIVEAPSPGPSIAGGSGQNNEFFLEQLLKYLHIAPNLKLFVDQPALKRCVAIGIDRAIREIISPVVERSVAIACITTKELVMKDFATEPDEQKLRNAAHLMVQNLAGSLALVTCKEPLRISMSNHIRSLLQMNTSENYHQMLDQIVQILASDNLDLACTLIEKAATDKSVKDTDEALDAAYAARKKHRERGASQPFIDAAFFSGRYPANLPEVLQPKMGGLQLHQLRVYEDFSRIPHIQPSSGVGGLEGSLPGALKEPLPQDFSPQQALERLNLIFAELDAAIARAPFPAMGLAPPDHEIHVLLKHVGSFLAQLLGRAQDIMPILAQRTLSKLYEVDSFLFVEIYLTILEAIVEVSPKLVKDITALILYLDDERRFHRKVTIGLIRQQLISMPDFDAYLAKAIDNRSKAALDFSLLVIRQCIIDAKVISASSLNMTIDALTKLAQANSQEELLKMLEEARAVVVPEKARKRASSTGTSPEPSATPRGLVTSVPQSLAKGGPMSDSSDPAAVRDQIVTVFEEWIVIVNQANLNDKAYIAFIAQLQQQGFFKDDEGSTRFFKICTELCIDNSTVVEPNGNTAMQYQPVDALCKLVVVLVKYSDNPTAKIAILNKVLSVVVRTLHKDYEMKKTKFNQRPYFRLFCNLLMDLNAPDPTLDPISINLLLAFSNAFIMLQPARLPAFCFAWLELISHRMFMPKLLLSKGQKGWPLFQRLLVELFKFMEPYLRNAELTDPIKILYKGTLRVLLVLLHDFPEFLCDYHFSFCDVIPPSCIQMRNLILSAFPRNMRLPDPFTPNLKVDLLPEINHSPRILSPFGPILMVNNFRQEVDTYLKNRAPVSFLLELRAKLLLPNQQVTAGTKYNVPLMNALVLYVGIQAIAQIQSSKGAPITHSAPMDIFQHLASDLDTEGRYLFLNAIANQLRYPNNHTHYFSCVLLYLFAEANLEIIQEQITRFVFSIALINFNRVLLERLIVNRPHPWGLLITFIELIKNPRYNFWRHRFTRCAPEFEKLFESVARSCMSIPAEEKKLG